MGAGNTKFDYSTEGEDGDLYHYGLTTVADKTTWRPGLVINFAGIEDPLISIMIGDQNTPPLPQNNYTHIFRAHNRETGVINVIYLKRVSKEEAEKFKNYRKPPTPPEMPNFKYSQPRPIRVARKQGAGGADDASNTHANSASVKKSTEEETQDILSAIEYAQDPSTGDDGASTATGNDESTTDTKNNESSDDDNVNVE